MKILIVYFSFSGATKSLAEDISLVTEGDLRELVLKNPYDFSKNSTVKDIRTEIETGHCPDLASGNETVADYDIIFIGTPNWLKTFAPPIRTFLRDVDIDDKVIVTFCTHGGGGLGKFADDLKEICLNSRFKDPIYFNGSYSLEDLERKLNEIL